MEEKEKKLNSPGTPKMPGAFLSIVNNCLFL